MKLEESEQLNHLLLNETYDVIIKLSPTWEILEFNDRSREIFRKKIY